MKMKSLAVGFGFFAASFLAANFCALGQETETNSPAADFKVLMTKTSDDIKDGKRTEAALGDDLKQFDALLDKYHGQKTDEVAKIMYFKGLLYAQVIGDTNKANAIFNQVKQDFSGTKFVTNLQKSEADAAAAKKIQAALVAGAPFPDFHETDLAGNELSVASHKGKVVLLDFWATWCPPCRAELPNVIATYQKHHAEGFDIIGISLDSDRAQLTEFLKTHEGMTWQQYFDGQGWQNKLAGHYGVRAIPFTLLIGPDGKIIDKNLRGDDLETAVAAAVAKK